jgi:hypothetical protein
MSYPRQYIDLAERFGKSPAWLSNVYNDIATHLAATFADVLRWRPALNNYHKLADFAKAIEQSGCPGNGLIWGFIDGTFNKFCRPEEAQELVYSGHKKGWGNKYQAIVTPDGMISSIWGPFAGRDNDVTMLTRSGLVEDLKRIMGMFVRLYLYGDSAYSNGFGIFAPFKNVNGHKWLDDPEKERNRKMSAYRIGIEHAFGLQENLWISNSMPKLHRSSVSPVVAYYLSGILLTNLYTCVYGNGIARKYNTGWYSEDEDEDEDEVAEGDFVFVPPPTVEGYLHGGK